MPCFVDSVVVYRNLAVNLSRVLSHFLSLLRTLRIIIACRSNGGNLRLYIIPHNHETFKVILIIQYHCLLLSLLLHLHACVRLC